MDELINDKEVESINYDNLMIDLHGKMKEKELVIEELRIEID
jgi:hypothetical protein